MSVLRIGSSADDVRRERLRAHDKHAADGNSAERLPADSTRWLPILTEELGEVARELCDHGHARPHRLRSELIQLAAMAAAWADAIERDDGA